MNKYQIIGRLIMLASASVVFYAISLLFSCSESHACGYDEQVVVNVQCKGCE